jgi:hypothetical protein
VRAFAGRLPTNASDFRPGGFDVEDSAAVVGMLGDEGVDLIEISGGTYESPSGCLGVQPGESGTARDAYFAGMAPRLRAMTDVPLALTGGLRRRTVMERLINERTVDVIGLGRPLIERPNLAEGLLEGTSDGIVLAPCPLPQRLEVFWWLNQFRRLGNGRDFDPDYSACPSPARHSDRPAHPTRRQHPRACHRPPGTPVAKRRAESGSSAGKHCRAPRATTCRPLTGHLSHFAACRAPARPSARGALLGR